MYSLTTKKTKSATCVSICNYEKAQLTDMFYSITIFLAMVLPSEKSLIK